jgi:hypothetical protein
MHSPSQGFANDELNDAACTENAKYGQSHYGQQTNRPIYKVKIFVWLAAIAFHV